MLRIEMLPAAHGDALWLEYGKSDDPHRVLIDAGPYNTYEAVRWRILSLPPGERHFELLVVTHVDADHIEGVIRLLQDDDLGCSFDDIWFNDWTAIEDLPGLPPLPPVLGPDHGEFLAALIRQIPDQEWNKPWGDEPIHVSPTGELPTHTLGGGLELTLLSPGLDELDNLRKEWDAVVRNAGFTPGDSQAALRQLRERRRLGPPRTTLGDETRPDTLDNSVANGSSIALLAEYDGVRMLLSGDAFATRLRSSLDRWMDETGASSVQLDAFKLPHHGSQANITPQLMEILRCRNYLVSTNGSTYHHPDAEAIDLLLEHHRRRGKAHLHFNYLSPETERYNDVADQRSREYEAFFPDGCALNLYSESERG